MTELRIIDFGRVSALRSQSIWHALAASAGKGGPTTLSFMRPGSSYVGIGMHRSIQEVDQEYCQSNGLPIYRRQVGGGPVYLDDKQLFFQVSSRREALPISRSAAISKVLRPFKSAFIAAGINADLDETGEFAVNGAKVCGHGAGEIEGGVVVVGNLIEKFDYVRAASIVNIADVRVKLEIESIMRRFVGVFANDINSEAFKDEAVASLSNALELNPKVSVLTDEEWKLVEAYDELLGDSSWTKNPEFLPALPRPLRVVKIRAGVYVVYNSVRGRQFLFSVVFGIVESMILEFEDFASNSGEKFELGVSLKNKSVDDVVAVLVSEGLLLDAEVAVLANAGVLLKEIAA